MTDISHIVKAQQAFFAAGQTRPVAFRKKQLRMLYHAVEQQEARILEALHADLNKCEYEAYLTEVGIAREEIRFALRHVGRWSRSRRVRTPFYHFPGASRIYPEPYGVALIIAPWNYPFQLTVAPLVAAIAAGNCAVLKPSEFSIATSQVLADLVAQYFDPGYITVVQGDVSVSQALLAEAFDTIFFTGSPGVGRIVMEAAARHLTPVTLELGGKSPCIVENDANLKLAAKRIVSGKFINAGQTCIAPDYLLVHRSVKEPLIEYMTETIRQFYSSNPIDHPDYPKVINQRHYDRLIGLMENATLLYGGAGDSKQRKIAPTIIGDVDWSHPVMKEEIFGPVLPVLVYDDLSEVIETVNSQPKPLALYLFTGSETTADRVLAAVSFGGGCVNDTLIHIATPYMPFGGVGTSGMGAYHGKFGFDAFTHYKSILHNTDKMDFPFRYPPFYNHLGLIKKVLK